MRLEWIEDILAVAEMGSFNSAAEARFLTPSAFTRRIRMIEETLGCALFDRSKKPVVLREHVRDMLPELQEAVVTLKRARQMLLEPVSAQNRRVTIMAQHALTATVAPQLLTLPGLGEDANVKIKSGRKSECLLEVVKREADFALVYENIDQRPDLETSIRISLGTERFLPVVTTELARVLKRATQTDRIPVISYPPSIFLGEVQRKALLSHSPESGQITSVAETGLSLAVVEFVKHGIGVGWVPHAIIQQDLASGALTSLEGRLPHFELNVTLLRTTNQLPPVAEDFWNAVDHPAGLLA